MYCRNCGKELLNNDNFCVNCGQKIIKEYIKNNDANIEKESIDNSKKDLPMNWWNFCKYFRFPVGIALMLINLCLVFYNTLYINLPIFIDICYIGLLVLTYYNYIKETRVGYNLLIFSLYFELFYNSIAYAIPEINNRISFTQSFIIYLTIFGLIYFLPSYIYFSKRKYVFNKNNIE